LCRVRLNLRAILVFAPGPDTAVQEETMLRYETSQFDNRDSEQMYEYLESRIEALKRRVEELELENNKLRWEQSTVEESASDLIYVASA
jgi:hypothetical protein